MAKEYADFEPVKGVKAIACAVFYAGTNVTVCAPTAAEVTEAVLALCDGGLVPDESKYQQIVIISSRHLESAK